MTRTSDWRHGVRSEHRRKRDKQPVRVSSIYKRPVGDRLIQLAIYRFQIAGHTDASGSAEYNRRLSRDRAETVRRFLVTRGIDPDRLEVVGNGEDELLLPDWPLHAGNRRVEIRNLGERSSN